MEQIMDLLENKHSWKDVMRKSCRINKLNIELASVYTPLRFRAAYARFKAIYQRRSQDKGERWLENQLKAFEWLAVALSCTSDLKIKDFGPSQIEKLFEVFYFKQLLTLEYEIRKLSEDPTERQTWQSEEETLLTKIVLEFPDNNNKWNDFARKLYESSEKKFFRTGKQCRQRWLNHLDPNKKHGEWTQQQDQNLAQLFLSDGKKWSQISRKLGGLRTEHMVKNRYKTIISRQRRNHPEISSEYSLLKALVNPQGLNKKETSIQEIKEEKTPLQSVKAENKSEQQIRKEEEREEIVPFLQQQEQRNKNQPQTSSTYELPHVYSPWMMSYQLTPTFSPFFVNVPTFSSFQASFNNQFYCPARTNDRDQL